MADNAIIIAQYSMGHVHPGSNMPQSQCGYAPRGAYPPCVDMPHDTNTNQWLINLVSIYYKIKQLHANIKSGFAFHLDCRVNVCAHADNQIDLSSGPQWL